MLYAKSVSPKPAIGAGKGVIADSVTSLIPVVADPLAPIDMLTGAMDSRLVFQAPSHSYVASDGLVKQSALNEWPLEYQNGMAVGRHEPEAAATNLINDPFYTNYAVSTAAVVNRWSAYGGGLGSVVQTGGVNDGPAVNTTQGYYRPAVYDGNNFIVPDTTDWTYQQISGDWQRLSVQANFATAQSAARFYNARQDANNFIYFTFAVPQGDVVMSSFRLPWQGANSNFRHSWAQAETGTRVSSPRNGTLAAFRAFVLKQAGAVGFTVIFTDGTSQTYNFTDADRVELAKATKNWALRYIKRIEFIKG